MAEHTFFFDKLKSPIGTDTLIVDEEGRLRMHAWDDPGETWRRLFHRRFGETPPVARKDPSGFISALSRYYDGDIFVLDGLKVAFQGTPFQHKVWEALRKIPGGTTTSYGALAKTIGEPAAVRAVGLANGSNPIGVVVPCHRVIGGNGMLTGYGGGLARKRWLLDHEARHAGAANFRLEA